MARGPGCPNGCPLDHHEPPCPHAIPEPSTRHSTGHELAAARREGVVKGRAQGYREGYDAGYREAAKRFHELGIQAGMAASSAEPAEPRVLSIESPQP